MTGMVVNVVNQASTVVVVRNEASGSTAVVSMPAAPVAVRVSSVGVQGPPGPAGGQTRSADAGASVSGHRVLIEQDDGTVIHADASTLSHAERIVGVSSNAAAEGDVVTIVQMGRMTDASLSFTAGDPLFLGADGAITATPPAAPAFLLQIGSALSADTINIRISRPIYRS